MTEERAAIIGVGLIGGSIAAALRGSGKHVVGFDLVPDHIRAALDRRLIDEGAQTLPSLLKGAETVVVALPIKSIVELLPQIDRLAPEEALLIDTGSVKSEVVNTMALLNGGHRAIGGHPLAGSQQSGPEAADANLFQGRSFVLSPSLKTGASTIDRAQNLVSALGARPILMTPVDHDEVLARTSHLPQLMASTLIRCLASNDAKYEGSGLRDMVRLAGSDPVMWRDILVSNSTQISAALRRCISQLQEIAGLIEEADADALQKWMQHSRTMWALYAESSTVTAPHLTEPTAARAEG